jgi:CDP-glycerol glycerophosphotransferase (TagB/SpsB family)
LYNSDLVIYVATTLGIDALVFNKPQIIIDFDGFENKKYTDSVKRYHDEDHMKKMLALGGVRVVKDQEELISAINDYLEDPSIDNDGRQKMTRQQLYISDGKSGKRVGEFILELLN